MAVKTINREHQIKLHLSSDWLKRCGYDGIECDVGDYAAVVDEFEDFEILIRFQKPTEVEKIRKKDRPVFMLDNPLQVKFLSEMVSRFGNRLLIDIHLQPTWTTGKITEIFEKAQDCEVVFTHSVDFKSKYGYFSPLLTHRTLSKLNKKGIEPQPRLDKKANNLSMEFGQWFEPEVETIFDNRKEKLPKFSIVIPVYNNKDFVLHVIKNLQNLDYKTKDYEVVLCDDGSSDGLQQDFLQLADQLKLSICFIHLPRSEERQMGDFQYRAGLTRNTGVAFTRGENLVFLDSDILVGSDFLKIIERELQEVDMIMCQRLHLGVDESHKLPAYTEIDKDDLMVVDHGYWNEFYEKGDRWNQLSHAWKYTCTHSLALSKSLFTKVGGLANNYNIYGYEDVELGYALKKENAEFKLSDNVVYHLTPKTERSEFNHESTRKMQLLSYSSQIFYHNTLDEGVFDHCGIYFKYPGQFNFQIRDRLMKLKSLFSRRSPGV